MGEAKVKSIGLKEGGKEEVVGVNFPEMSTKLITIKRTTSTWTRVCQEVTSSTQKRPEKNTGRKLQQDKTQEEETFKIN